MKKLVPSMIVIGMIFVMLALLVNSGKENTEMNNTIEVKAEIVETDNSDMIQSGVSRIGFQITKIKILEGKYKGKIIEAGNELVGAREFDNYFKPGDKIIAAIYIKEGKICGAKAVEYFRQNWEFALFALFILCLILYARFIGLKALLSFVASLYLIWTYLIPGLLEGKNPLILATIVLTMLSAIIIFSIAGFTRKGIAAFGGTICGLLLTVGLTLFFGSKLALYGMTQAFASTLLFSGYSHLNMQYIFYAAIIIGASGAAMDIAMDVAASMAEIKLKKPDIDMKELVQSGFNVGRAVIGTMTTTLLLAYSGGYLTLLMLFMTKNSSFGRILNLKIVASEIMRTLVGSIGLVLVAPLTAIFAGWILCTDIKLMKNFKNRKAEAELSIDEQES